MCKSLIGIPQSIQHLNKLESLDVQGCESIMSIPDCNGLKSLKKIYLNRCSKLKRLPELPNNLKELDLHGCKSLLEIPLSFKYLTNLESLELDGCESLSSIPDCRGLISLGKVSATGCWKLKMLPEFPNNVGGLTLRDIPIEELTSSLEDLCRLESLDLKDCSRLKSLPSSVSKGTGIREVPSSFSRYKGEDGVGLLLPPLLGFHNLSSLELSDCGITELPDNIGCLTSLERLSLGGNNFESIPESMINISNLKFLDISYCQRIKVLPKFRCWTYISADDCTLLEELSCPSFHNDIFAMHSQSIEANFINCFKLNRNLLNNFVNDTLLNLLNIQGLAASVKRRSHHQVYEGAPLSVRMCYPGNEIPECFNI